MIEYGNLLSSSDTKGNRDVAYVLYQLAVDEYQDRDSALKTAKWYASQIGKEKIAKNITLLPEI